MEKKLRIGVLASGNGTDLQSIIDASDDKRIKSNISVVISDKKDAYALKRAEKHEIPQYFIDPKNKTVEEHENEINKILTNKNIDLIIGAGYMKILSPSFVKKWYKKMINIHPAILPSFKGANGQGDAFEYGVKISGCTTHFIDEHMDHGPIILQAAVLVKPGDDKNSLAERILKVEHQILPRTIQLFEENCLTIKDRKVEIKSKESWKEKYKKIPDVLYCEGY